MSTADKKAAVKALFNEHVNPLMTAMRFARTGRAYRRYNAEGDAVVVEFRTSSVSTPETYVFLIELALVPSVWLRWMRHEAIWKAEGEPRVGEGLVECRLKPAAADKPVDVERGLRVLARGTFISELMPGLPRWSVDSGESVAACGREITERLPAVATAYIELLDRNVFLQRLRDGEKLPGTCPKLAARAVLLLEGGMTDELDQVLDDINFQGTGNDFVSWVRSQMPPPRDQ
ncbi:hypothetical protein [Phytohabitans kaempferiae]|uniref:DUF4304 domain-containing protein n=1 Tax=Phytohabitans kaempferiae TaxID=1620943 RepID=A0ABV6MGW3_9ACTN